MKEAIEDSGRGGVVLEQLAPIFDGSMGRLEVTNNSRACLLMVHRCIPSLMISSLSGSTDNIPVSQDS